MNCNQEPKYEIKEGKLVNRQSGVAIPDDEPVFILRAQDKHAAEAIEAYYEILAEAEAGEGETITDETLEAVDARVVQFEKFAIKHPSRMKEPDTEKTEAWDNLE